LARTISDRRIRAGGKEIAKSPGLVQIIHSGAVRRLMVSWQGCDGICIAIRLRQVLIVWPAVRGLGGRPAERLTLRERLTMQEQAGRLMANLTASVVRITG
jgi:hypothetical protein